MENRPADRVVEVEVSGLKFNVRDGSSDIKSINEVIGKNSYNRRDFPLKISDRWIDLGANIGAFTCLVASHGARVSAYEPDPMNFELLKQNVALNGLERLVDLNQVAVVADPNKKLIEFHVNSARKNYWRNSTIKKWRGGFTILVKARHFSEVLDGSDIKMDVEGSEMELIESIEKKPSYRLVYEWSFDIDRSIPRFRKSIDKLGGWYDNVRYAKFDETQLLWNSSWFPPCRTVWCS